MPITILDAITHDIRFPTSDRLDGSDAMNRDPTTRPRTSSCGPTPPTGSKVTA